MMQEQTRDRKYWKSILKAPPNELVITEMAECLTSEVNLNLCRILPRKGSWFNLLRFHMKTTPKALRDLLVTGSKQLQTQKALANI